MTLSFGDSSGGTRHEETFELDPWLLAEPVIQAARDWLRLQGREAACQARAYVGWDLAPESERCLVVELHEGDAVLWQGLVPREELSRIAARGGRALQAAGAWPPIIASKDTAGLTWLCCRREGDPTVTHLAAQVGAELPSSGNTLGIEIDAPPSASVSFASSVSSESSASAMLPSVVDWTAFHKTQLLSQDEDPDLFVLFSTGVWSEVVAMLDESMRAHEERAVYLYGKRSRVLRENGYLPLFELTHCELAQYSEASATRLVLDHSALLDPTALGHPALGHPALGHAALALLHSHMPGFGLAASDPDLRDIDDINCGGPSAISMIFEASSRHCTGAPAHSVYARLGARGACVHKAKACVAVFEESVVEEALVADGENKEANSAHA